MNLTSVLKAQLRAISAKARISATEYALRRQKLANEMSDNSLAILAGDQLKYRTGSVVFYQFQQEANFYYLTGFAEPNALMIIEKASGADSCRFHLLVESNDAHSEKWEGKRTGLEEAREHFGADASESMNNLRTYMQALVKGCSKIYTDLEGSQASGLSRLFSKRTRPTSTSSQWHAIFGTKKKESVSPILRKLRNVKSSDEVACMREAGQISGRVFTEAMANNFAQESHLAAFMDYKFRVGGCEGSAYIPVVAGGVNALTIHYTKNNAPLKDGDLCLVDAGGQYNGYATDITRTWPVNGKFSPAQKDLYQAVLNVQRRCIDLCTEKQQISLDHLHNQSLQFMKEELKNVSFSVFEGDLQRILYPHSVGHGVGLDLHEHLPARGYPLVEGQTITIEPGLYVPKESSWPKHYQGIGIRIEDVVCVMKDDPLILTTEAAKEIVDIGNLR